MNSAVHSEIAAVPAERLVTEAQLLRPLPSLRAQIGKLVIRKVDKLSCVRFGSARYSVPIRHIGKQVEVRVNNGTIQVVLLGAVIAEHAVVAPGEASVLDDHYGGERPTPRRAVRPKTAAEIAFCSLGPVAETFIKAAAASGATTLAGDLEELAGLQAAHGREPLIAALPQLRPFGHDLGDFGQKLRAHDQLEGSAGQPVLKDSVRRAGADRGGNEHVRVQNYSHGDVGQGVRRRRRTARDSPTASFMASSSVNSVLASTLRVSRFCRSRLKYSHAAWRVIPRAAPIWSHETPASRAARTRSSRTRSSSASLRVSSRSASTGSAGRWSNAITLTTVRIP